jgi:tRNA threonylcarbamoyladenosine biosynthesis protein TsaB
MEFMATDNELRLLVLETSGRVGYVALASGAELGEVRRMDESRRHARDLAPAVAELCAARAWKPRELNGVIVSLGPGSYTGLRVGIISAKALAYATGCAVLGIETFAAIARQTPVEAERVEVLADAQQKKVYVQRWRHDGMEWRAESAMAIQPIVDWLANLEPGTWVSGPGVRLCETSIPTANPVVPQMQREPLPESLLRIGLERWRRGERDDPLKIEPLYLRPSNAEENWDRLGLDRGARKQGDKENAL